MRERLKVIIRKELIQALREPRMRVLPNGGVTRKAVKQSEIGTIRFD